MATKQFSSAPTVHIDEDLPNGSSVPNTLFQHLLTSYFSFLVGLLPRSKFVG